MGLDGLSAIGMVFEVSEERLLVATDDGRLLCLSREAAPTTLLVLDGETGPDPSTLRGACVNSDEKTLFLCDDLDVYRCTLDLDEGVCSAPAMLPQLEASLGSGSEVTGIACDVNGNLYVSASEGVVVVDETGDAMMRVTTPEAASGLCFGGPSMSDLLVTAGDTLWQVKTNTQGVTPPSPAFLTKMKKLGTGDEFRHVGW